MKDNDFIIDLSNLYEKRKEVNIIKNSSEFNLNYEGIELYSSLHLKGKLEDLRYKWVFEGTIDTSLKVSCSVCLEEFVMPITSSLKVSYMPYSQESTEEEGELELSKEEIDTYFYTDNCIDLREAVRDQVILSLPITIRCSNPCKGLCPRCGANLNYEDCKCKQEAYESPFSVLKIVKFKKENS